MRLRTEENSMPGFFRWHAGHYRWRQAEYWLSSRGRQSRPWRSSQAIAGAIAEDTMYGVDFISAPGNGKTFFYYPNSQPLMNTDLFRISAFRTCTCPRGTLDSSFVLDDVNRDLLRRHVVNWNDVCKSHKSILT